MGGFTQVNDDMNAVLKDLVSDQITKAKKVPNRLLDLFSGNGNLSEQVLKQMGLSDIDLILFARAIEPSLFKLIFQLPTM